MSTPLWQAGTIYASGSLVQPVSTPPPVPDQVTNGGFESGNTGWTLDSGFTIGEFGNGTHFQGTWSLQWNLTGEARAVNNNATEVSPGQIINANCQVQQGASNAGQAGARVEVLWYDSSDEFLSSTQGTLIDSGSNSTWKQSSIAAVAPAGAAFARFSVAAFRTGGSHALWIDNCSWDATVSSFPDGLVFRAVQAVAGYSGSSEPIWPFTVGSTVVDNEVTWEAVIATRVTWEASPIFVSGDYEPDFPEAPDATVADGTILWTAMNWRVTQAPHSKVVAIGASKIFAADEDIIPFSATVNPLDWTTPQDAGYIPFGLNTFGSTPVTALGLYRSNLVAFNSEAYQMWQIDEDPANMAILDASPVACLFPKSVQPVSNDLVMCTPEGVRNIGIAGASTNLQAGYFGAQVDPLVIEKINAGLIPFALFWPSMGQYWLIFDADNGSEAFVLTMNGGAKDQSWSRYLFPDRITDWAILEGDLYLRTEDLVWRVDPEELQDDVSFAVPVIDGMDIPSAPGAYLVWPNAVLAVRSQGSIGVPQTPNGYVGGGVPDEGAFAVIANAGTTGATEEFVVQVDGQDEVGGSISEVITKSSGTLFAIGSTRFFFITSVTLLSSVAGSDGFYCVGYQTFTPDTDPNADTLTVQIRGAISISSSTSTPTVQALGLLGTSYPMDVPDGSVVTVMRKSGTAAKTFTINGVEDIVLPTGVSQQEVIGVDEYSTITGNTRTPSGNNILVDVGVLITVAVSGTPFEGYISWPYLDFGILGVDKMLEGFDLVADGTFRVSFGYSQRDFSLATPDYALDGDTLVGGMVPMPLTAPSFQLRLTFDADQSWEWFAANLYINNESTG